MINRCANCNGTLILSSDHSKWICEYCDSEFAISSVSGKQDTSDDTVGSEKLSSEALQKIKAYLSAGQKLNAIKYIKEICNMSLAEALAFVDKYNKNNP